MTKTELKIIRAISEKTRFSIISMLMKNPKGIMVSSIKKRTKTEATLLSHHLSILKNVGLITSIRTGKTIRYNINPKSKNIEGTAIVTKSFTITIR